MIRNVAEMFEVNLNKQLDLCKLDKCPVEPEL